MTLQAAIRDWTRLYGLAEPEDKRGATVAFVQGWLYACWAADPEGHPPDLNEMTEDAVDWLESFKASDFSANDQMEARDE